MKCIDPAKFNRKVVFQRNTPTQDATGGQVDSWADAISAWAMIKPASTYDRIIAMREQAAIPVVFRCRYNPNITSDLRISYDTRTFKIHSVVDLEEAHQYMEVLAEEIEIDG